MTTSNDAKPAATFDNSIIRDKKREHSEWR